MIEFLKQLLFIDQKTGLMSTTKFWQHVGYATMVWTFTYAVVYGSKAETILWLIFGLVVVGNRSVLKLLGKDTKRDE